ncbi:MAG: ABC transporter permease [Chitinophagales bacterium]|mgnify:FL=1|jgi:putative ABC transport system permease protein|nr:ABC transporter permease [Chitinophagales bacterium]
MRHMITVLGETLKLTLQQLWLNKLRTFLSLFGITVGIFSIIAILTAVDALKNNINQSINSLGDNILFVNKWAWTFDGPSDYPWWKYAERPNVKYENFKFVQAKSKLADAVTFEINPRQAPEVSYRDKKTYKAQLSAVTADYGKVFQLDIARGRFLSAMEVNNGLNVCVIGGEIAEKLFKNNDNPVGLQLRIAGKPVQVIGVIAKKGQDLLGFNYDKVVIVPLNYYERNFSYEPYQVDMTLEVRTRPGVSLEALKNELIGIMRASRKLRPSQEDNFSVNQLSVIAKGFDGVFDSLGMVKWVIGAFSLIVGGFGIANIMFVSVSERRPIIGIKKALGATRNDILLEFLIEAIFLCMMGALVGLLLVYIMCIFATKASGMDFVLTAGNVGIAFGISFLLGILAGIIPAYMAAKMEPVDAIRSK